jgi:uncharacterized membrane protein
MLQVFGIMIFIGFISFFSFGLCAENAIAGNKTVQEVTRYTFISLLGLFCFFLGAIGAVILKA